MLRFLYLASLCVGAMSELTGPVVDTPLGRVVGWERLSRDGRVYQAWTGIPYAQPPVGKLRFKAPKPAQKWSGVLNATGESSICMQPSSRASSSKVSEDCLYLSVYRPKNGQQQMPVILHVHGGAFIVGSMGPRENADYLMDEDVVLVRIQYRLGAMGFMSLGSKLMPGNFGIKDQVQALKWVKQNIASFGGNPGSVTVIGESAGAASTHILLKTPAADDLVHRALSDSGSVNRFWSLLKAEIVRNATLDLAKKVGCSLGGSDEEIFECLQKVDGNAIVRVGSGLSSHLTFVPCIEPEGAEDAIATEDISMRPVNKPWITSNAEAEYTLFQNMPTPQQIAEYHEHLDSYLATFIDDFLQQPDAYRTSIGTQLLKNYYFPVMEPMENFTIEISEVDADLYFPYSALHNLLNHAGPKWYYFFEYVGEYSRYDFKGNLREPEVAGHSEQVVYYLNMRSRKPKLSPKETPEDYEVSKRMIKYLVNFAYYDDPTPPGSPLKWDEFTGFRVLRISESGSDAMADVTLVQKLVNIVNLWSYVIGW